MFMFHYSPLFINSNLFCEIKEEEEEEETEIG
jgi:hypothetical protein